MFGTFGSELARIRAESLRDDGAPRSAKAPGRLRRAVGHVFVGAGERLLRDRRDMHGTVRLGGDA